MPRIEAVIIAFVLVAIENAVAVRIEISRIGAELDLDEAFADTEIHYPQEPSLASRSLSGGSFLLLKVSWRRSHRDGGHSSPPPGLRGEAP